MPSALTDEDREKIETLAEKILEAYGAKEPPVPVEQIAARPPKGLKSLELENMSYVFGFGEHQHEFRMALTRLLYRQICDSGWAGVELPYTRDAARYFASCLMMPRSWVLKAIRNPFVDLTRLSEKFQVPEYEMGTRLAQLKKKVRGMQ